MKIFHNSGNSGNTPLSDDSPCIIDASSLITYLEGKPKGAVIQRILEQARSCGSKMRVTALDILTIYLKGITEQPDSFADLLALLDQLPIDVQPVSKEIALQTAKLMAEHQGLQLNSGISAYLAKSLGGTLITADPAICNMKILPEGLVVYVGDDASTG